MKEESAVSSRYIVLIALVMVIITGACQKPVDHTREDPVRYTDAEQNHLDTFNQTPITLKGSVISENGNPVAGCRVQWGDRSTTTGADGSFVLNGISRLNRLLSIAADGFRRELLPVHVNRPLTEKEVIIEPIVLFPVELGMTRMLFAGDTAFGRRFLDPSDQTPRDQMPDDNPDALIQVSNPGPGTTAVLQFVRPYFQEADFSSVNFETPVTNDPSTPHQTKDFAYFTLPGSLPALKDLGVDYVTLGNNHVYDYLEPGLKSTLDHLDDAGIPYSGAALTLEGSFSGYRINLGGSGYSFLGMTSISGRKHAVSYVADEVKGGAADLTLNDEVEAAIQRELNEGFIPVLQLHGGTEYSYEPTDYIRGSMERISGYGAALIISHHPHMAQGAGLFNGIVTIYGLGNFAFDQDRAETLMGVLARVDMKGMDVRRLRLLPVYLEDYRPRPVSGRLAGLVLRRLAEFSGDEVYAYPYHSQLWVEWGNQAPRTVTRQVGIDITVPGSGVYVLDLRGYGLPEESLSSVRFDNSTAQARIGRDLMYYGDFEDFDTDGQILDMARWDVTNDSVYPTMLHVYRGTAGVASSRSAANDGDSVIPFRNRVRVMGDELHTPNKDLTFFGYIKGENAGAVKVIARFAASVEERTFGEETVYSRGAGTYNWEQIAADIHMPPDDPAFTGDPTANPRAVRVFLRHSPPASDSGIAAFDEIAIINWEETVNDGDTLSFPHARDFLKIIAPPGPLRVTCRFSAYRPVAVD